MMEERREFDVVVFGATGFTGALVCDYLAHHAPKALRWAVAGRTADAVEAKRTHCQSVFGASVGGVVATSDAPDAMVARTRVIISTVGPFLGRGEPLVAACVRLGTHYVDTTGEALFVRAIADAHHDAAVRAGVKIVPCCGYDCIPVDLCALFLVSEMRSQLGWLDVERMEGYAALQLLWRHVGDGLGGHGPPAWARSACCLLLNAPGHEGPPVGTWHSMLPGYSSDTGRWTFPGVMAIINERIVRRTQSLLLAAPQAYTKATDGDGKAYHRKNGFVFRDYGSSSSVLVALATWASMLVFVLLCSITWVREVVVRPLLPQPGQGPSEERRRKSKFTHTLVARAVTPLGARVVGKAMVSGGDPGYTETSKMIAESAMMLALHADELPDVGGVLTPATAFGLPLLKRLHRLGIRFDLLSVTPQ